MATEGGGKSRVADDILAALIRVEAGLERTERTTTMLMWSLIVAVVVQLGALGAVVVLLHRQISSTTLSLSDVQQDTAAVARGIQDVLKTLYGLEGKIEGMGSRGASGADVSGSVMELLNSPAVKDALREYPKFMKENFDILDGHKPRQSQRSRQKDSQ